MDDNLVILNPYASRGRAQARILEVQQALTAAGVSYDLEVTEGRGHAIELARREREKGRPLVIAAGGDGTVNEVVNGLAQAAGDGLVGPLGVLPMGSGNDFAEAMGVAKDLAMAARRLRQHQVRRVDLGRVNDRYFANNVGMGFEAQASLESQKITWLRGLPMYMVAIFRSLVNYPFPEIDVAWDGGHITGKRIFLLSIGNGRRVGGGFLITPDAEPDDGLLDLCIADALPRWQVLRLLPKAMRGTHRNEPAVYLTRSAWVRVSCADSLLVHADGEILWRNAQKLDVSLDAGRLGVVV